MDHVCFKIFFFYCVLSSTVPFKFPDEVDNVKTEVLNVGKHIARPHIGVFSRVTDYLIDRVSGPSPREKEIAMDKSLLSQDPERVKFFIYENPNNPAQYTELRIGDVQLARSTSLRSHRPTKILIHGFRQNFNGRFPQTTKNVYLQYTNYNIICVDWGPLARPTARLGPLFYPFVADNVPRVGEKVAEFIMFLRHNDLISSLGLVHIVGFSLGAHVAGVAGRLVAERFGGYRIGRITGLDPAGPHFLTTKAENRLDDEDADFVDVIHTNEGQLGYIGRLGHVDFYPNGGTHQPNCLDMDDRSTHFLSSLNQAISGSCSHNRAALYFAKSIPTKQIVACKCNSWLEFRARCKYSCHNKVVFGENCSPNTRGKYYLEIDE